MSHLLQTKESKQLWNSSKRTSIIDNSKVKESIIAPGGGLKFVGQIPNEIIYFYYLKGDTYCLQNRDLVLKNESSSQYINFKIQCNHPTHYKVHPSNAEIPPKKTIEIIIQINDIEEAAEIGSIFFVKFASDKFRIQWHSYHESERNYYLNCLNSKAGTSTKLYPFNQRLFSVHIAIEEQEQNQNQNRKRPFQLGGKILETIVLQKRELSRLQDLIMEKETEKGNCGYLSCWAIVILSMIAFAGGALL